MLNVARSMSAEDRARATEETVFADAINENGEVMTSSPAPTPLTSRAVKAVVPDDVATQCGSRRSSRRRASNAPTTSPCAAAAVEDAHDGAFLVLADGRPRERDMRGWRLECQGPSSPGAMRSARDRPQRESRSVGGLALAFRRSYRYSHRRVGSSRLDSLDPLVSSRRSRTGLRDVGLLLNPARVGEDAAADRWAASCPDTERLRHEHVTGRRAVFQRFARAGVNRPDHGERGRAKARTIADSLPGRRCSPPGGRSRKSSGRPPMAVGAGRASRRSSARRAASNITSPNWSTPARSLAGQVVHRRVGRTKSRSAM